jgi:hypothetical protein
MASKYMKKNSALLIIKKHWDSISPHSKWLSSSKQKINTGEDPNVKEHLHHVHRNIN